MPKIIDSFSDRIDGNTPFENESGHRADDSKTRVSTSCLFTSSAIETDFFFFKEFLASAKIASSSVDTFGLNVRKFRLPYTSKSCYYNNSL